MSKKHPRKFYNLVDNFSLGRFVAEQRVKLARRYGKEDINLDKSEIREYVLLRKEWNKILASGLEKGWMSVFGYAYGTYATFCPFQSQLDDFDREISGLTKTARENL